MDADNAAHTTKIRVRYAETDQQGVVYNSHFLVYFEVGRTEYLRAAGLVYRDLEARGIYLAVVEASCRYRAPARYDDLLDITTWVERLRPARVDFAHRLLRPADDVRIADGRVVLVCLDASGKPRAIPPDVRTCLAARGANRGR
jgi:acyl-CoA thioester hydrolase